MLSHENNLLLTEAGPGTAFGQLLRRFWVPALLSSEVAEPDGPPVRTTILGEELLAFRDSSGMVGLVDAYCAHRGAPLFFGRNEECGLRCVYHGWKYDRAGRCVDMPNEPAGSRFKERIRITAYPTQEAGGVVWAYLGPSDAAPELPQLEWLTVPASHVHIEKHLVEANFLQALEGDHDSSHASALHSTLGGGIADKWLAGRTRHGNAHMLDKAPKLFVVETTYGILTGSRRNAGDGLYLWRIVPWLKPYFSLIAQEPGHPMTLNVRVPMDDENSWFYRIQYHPDRPLTGAEREALSRSSTLNSERIPGTFTGVENRHNDYLIDRQKQRTETFSGIKSIPAQDRAMTERMVSIPGRPGTVDRSKEHLGSSDASLIQIRKSLLRSIRDLENGRAPAESFDGKRYMVRAPALILADEIAFEAGAEPYLTGKTWAPQDLDGLTPKA